MPEAAETTRETKATRTRGRILQAATQEFAEYGYTHASLRRIAAASGLQLGSLYFHFAAKEELAAEVLNRGVAIALEQMSTALAPLAEAPAKQRFEAAMEAHIRALKESGAQSAAVVRMVDTFPDHLRAPQSAPLRRYARAWDRLVRDAQQEGAIAADLNTGVVRDLVISAMNGTLPLRSTSPPILARTLSRLIFGGT